MYVWIFNCDQCLCCLWNKTKFCVQIIQSSLLIVWISPYTVPTMFFCYNVLFGQSIIPGVSETVWRSNHDRRKHSEIWANTVNQSKFHGNLNHYLKLKGYYALALHKIRFWLMRVFVISDFKFAMLFSLTRLVFRHIQKEPYPVKWINS